MSNHLKLIHFLDDIQPEEVEIHGGKAANLVRLSNLGFLVPRSFSISSAAFTQMLENNQNLIDLIEKADNSDDFEELLEISVNLQKAVGNYKIPEDLVSEIKQSFSYLQKNVESSEFGFAVRSSATIEDRSDVSFAGQAESYLCVMNEIDIIESVKKVWQSAYSERAVIYLQTKEIPLKQVKMAVVVQEMMPVNISGVMFTANVVNNSTDEMLINATWGLGDSLVSGKIVPDTYILTKNPLSVTQRNLGEKKFTSQLETNQPVLVATPEHKQSEYTLNDETLFDIADVGMKIESGMESPQDIEWCLRPDGGLVILQSRPITTLSVPSSHEVKSQE
ncbi:MAG: PEP/pyruvate-binding domain-containing protein [Candidatus Thorarchaeota archaeon]